MSNWVDVPLKKNFKMGKDLPVNEECLWVMAVEWFYLLLKPLLVALVDHVVFTCFQV